MPSSNSLIGYSSVTLVDPVNTGDSLIGYSTVTLADPIPETGYGPSDIGYSTATLQTLPRPNGVWTGSTWGYVPIVGWDGTSWR